MSHDRILMPIHLSIDNYDLDTFLEIAKRHPQSHFGYVVTPNADHVIRYYEDPEFRNLYAQAAYILMDSRFLGNLIALTKFLLMPVCRGSDLTYDVFSKLVACDDRIVVVGGTASQAQVLRKQFHLKNLFHIDPPMGFIRDPDAVAKCVHEIEALSPFRFCILAVGCPQQEILAEKLKARGIARGLALCTGASINFITGAEKRAPSWMRPLGLEWLYRLYQAPRRLAYRYLVRGPRIFWVLPRIKVILRRAASAPPAASRQLS